MKESDTIEKAIKLLKGHYYGNILLLAVIFLLFIFKLIPHFWEGMEINVTAERYAIVISIITIPLSLKYFADQLKKIPRPSEVPIATEKYKKASSLRLYSISAITLMHIILFGISRNMNFFWFTVVLFIVFLYCRPSKLELQNLTEKEKAMQSEPDQSEGESIPVEITEIESEEIEERTAKTQNEAEQK